MSIVTAGLLITFSGILVACIGLLDVVPNASQTFNYIIIGLGWIFILIGIVVRIIGMKMEKKYNQDQKR